MPSMPALETYEIMQDDDDTYAVVFARTGTVVHLNGVPQLGLDLDRADDVADHLEAIDRIAAARNEDKVTACFMAKRPQLSAACGTIFDRGI